MTGPSVTPEVVPSPTTAWPDLTSSPPSTAASTRAGSPSPTSTGKPTGSPPSWRLEIEAPDGRIWGANNGRPHWRVEASRRRLWRHLGWARALHAGLPRLAAADLKVTIHLRNWARADAHNFPGGASLKGLVDGLVDAKVIPDDAEPYLTMAMPTLAPLAGGRPRVVVEITPKALLHDHEAAS